MPVEPQPKFTLKAVELWAKTPANAKRLLLVNVWCSRFRHSVTITNFT
jgi:hypothetical protein